jgi:hypothetical protein
MKTPSMLKKELKFGGKRTGWVMRVLDTEEMSGIEIYSLTGEKPHIESAHVIGPSKSYLALLQDKLYMSDLVYVLNDHLPMFSMARLDARQQNLKVILDKIWKPIPKEIALYTLDFEVDKNVWVPRVLGPEL